MTRVPVAHPERVMGDATLDAGFYELVRTHIISSQNRNFENGENISSIECWREPVHQFVEKEIA